MQMKSVVRLKDLSRLTAHKSAKLHDHVEDHNQTHQSYINQHNAL